MTLAFSLSLPSWHVQCLKPTLVHRNVCPNAGLGNSIVWLGAEAPGRMGRRRLLTSGARPIYSAA